MSGVRGQQDRFAERARWAIRQRIRSMREERGMSQMHLSRKSGVKPQSVSSHELGVVSTPLVTLVKYAAAFGVPPSVILSVLDEVE